MITVIQSHPRRRFVPHAVFAALVVIALAWSVPAAYAVPLPDGANAFNSPGFIVRHAWVKFALVATRPFRGNLSREEEDAKVARFFDLNHLILDDERIAGDPASNPEAASAAREEGARARSERADVENIVEFILEGRLTRVIKEAGLTRHIGGDIVWPPVNIEFQDPPAVLIESPRSEIRKQSETLLQGDLPIERVQRIESDAERDGRTSALVVQIGGIAMYPAIIPEDDDYHFILQDIAHEWTHHYLFFAPLGRAYFESSKLTTLNETVADRVGQELGDRLFAEYPPPAKSPVAVEAESATPDEVLSDVAQASPFALGQAMSPAQSSSFPSTLRLAAPRPAAIDFTKVMRDLRRQVEALLADGKIVDAEQLMEQQRDFLAANGYYIRRLNQAYFAFHGSYADSAGSIDPIGPKLEALRNQSGSLANFVKVVRAFTSETDLDAALASR